MVNKWVKHVQDYAQKHGLSYGCALSKPDLKDGYIPSVKMSNKEKMKLKDDAIVKGIVNSLVKRIRDMTDSDRPIVTMKYHAASSDVKDIIKKDYPVLINFIYKWLIING